ncbi:MAG: hypothetical protein ACO377_14350 [Pseudomonadales bacterium]
MLTVETGIPIPDQSSRSWRTGQMKYPEMRQLEVGQSLFFPAGHFATYADRRRYLIAFARYGFGSKRKFEREYYDDGSFRVWRTA